MRSEVAVGTSGTGICAKWRFWVNASFWERWMPVLKSWHRNFLKPNKPQETPGCVGSLRCPAAAAAAALLGSELLLSGMRKRALVSCG